MSWKLYRKLHRNGWFRCSSILRSLIIFRTLSERTISSFRMYFSANVRPVSFRSTIRTFPNAPLPTTRSKRKWLRLTSSVMHIGFPLELPMAECGLGARGWLSCQEGPVIHACQCLLAYVQDALRFSGLFFPRCIARHQIQILCLFRGRVLQETVRTAIVPVTAFLADRPASCSISMQSSNAQYFLQATEECHRMSRPKVRY